jgi:hypothetical protein
MLKDPDLVKRVRADVEGLGVAGEGDLSLTIYLVGVSRLLRRPAAAIVQGPTASGKSYLIEKVSALFPSEAVLFATQITPQALFYLKPGSLEHRFVIAGERSRAKGGENADATRALREMLSSGKLVKLVPKKVDGTTQTVVVEQRGPIAYVESTTRTRVFEEDANRCILLTTDERAEQTRRIVDRLAQEYSGATADVPASEIIDRHHALQRMLKPHPVVVPFAKRLGESIRHDRVEVRRVFPQLLTMVQASALLHQRQRQLDGQRGLVAGREDYVLAQRLLAKPLERLLGGGLSEPAQRFRDRLRAKKEGLPEVFTVADASRDESAGKSSIYGWIEELHEAGLVELVQEPRGRAAAKWRLANEEADRKVTAILPTPEKMFG